MLRKNTKVAIFDLFIYYTHCNMGRITRIIELYTLKISTFNSILIRVSQGRGVGDSNIVTI